MGAHGAAAPVSNAKLVGEVHVQVVLAGVELRARQAAWTAAALAAGLLGALGLAVTFAPNLWTLRFTQDPAVVASLVAGELSDAALVRLGAAVGSVAGVYQLSVAAVPGDVP